jgi:uncharacterized phiE125 gp8 family phage protein
MILTETSPAAVTPVSLAEFKSHLRLAEGFAPDPAEDALLDHYLRNATSVVEARIGRALIRREFMLQVAAWDRDGHLVLPVGPVALIGSLSFILDAATIELPATSWSLEPGTSRQLLSGPGGGTLPAIPQGYSAALVFNAGFGDSPGDMPGELAQAVMLLAAHYFEHRYGEAVSGTGIPAGVQALLETRRPARL